MIYAACKEERSVMMKKKIKMMMMMMMVIMMISIVRRGIVKIFQKKKMHLGDNDKNIRS